MTAGSDDLRDRGRERRPLRLSAFVMNTNSHIQHGLWRHPDARQHEFTSLRLWTDLARTLERGRFDAIFFADVLGLYGPARGDYTVNAREGLQFPSNDPSVLLGALAAVTEHLGLVFTSSVLQAHPFEFARRVSTLDHLSGGRVGWNVVTSAQESAARNFGADGLEEHDERYRWAEEYLKVVYKLWEGSWDDDALVVDKALGHREDAVYADARGIHRIDHVGPRYRVAGPHQSPPSPQRTPVIFQAGSSPAGSAFAARHAEGQFILTSGLDKTRALIEETRAKVAGTGRDPADLAFFLGQAFVVGGTEHEARRKEAELDEYLSSDGFLLHSNLAFDPETGEPLDPDTPLSELSTKTNVSHLRWMRELSPDPDPRVRDLATLAARLRGRVVGTPEQIADRLAEWRDAGVDGINVMNWVLPGSFEEFVDEVVPVLQDRGLAQREYTPGTLRRKLFGRDLLPDEHPARSFHNAFREVVAR
ncbi:LLM class flavin-dependent oxidoreductase [Planctomonas deserti]|uniref:LLM class flavin-dependent oxidoreductase n=1 Tax=Planctomonas deserti TaxID=2144185 RepID=UPI000D3DC707|nr:LLM class flavin-dependent oxidoreductase [Planctomonas deserti]